MWFNVMSPRLIWAQGMCGERRKECNERGEKLPLITSGVQSSGWGVQVEGKGLGGLVKAQLGQQLDKRPQCSSWSTRPLTSEQVTTWLASCLLGCTPAVLRVCRGRSSSGMGRSLMGSGRQCR